MKIRDFSVVRLSLGLEPLPVCLYQCRYMCLAGSRANPRLGYTLGCGGGDFKKAIPSIEYCEKRVYGLFKNKRSCRRQPEALCWLDGVALFQAARSRIL